MTLNSKMATNGNRSHRQYPSTGGATNTPGPSRQSLPQFLAQLVQLLPVSHPNPGPIRQFHAQSTPICGHSARPPELVRVLLPSPRSTTSPRPTPPRCTSPRTCSAARPHPRRHFRIPLHQPPPLPLLITTPFGSCSSDSELRLSGTI